MLLCRQTTIHARGPQVHEQCLSSAGLCDLMGSVPHLDLASSRAHTPVLVSVCSCLPILPLPLLIMLPFDSESLHPVSKSSR